MPRSIFRDDVLAGKRVLITGGGTGLGRGVAAALVAHGAEVHLWGRRLSVLHESAAEASGGRADRVFVQSVDVRDATQVDAAMSELWANHGPLTSVINNAAGNFIAPTESLSAHAFEAISSTVMNGSFNTTALAPGPIPTDYAWEMLNPTDRSSVGATQPDQIPMGRVGTIDELAALTIFLLSDACDYLTGAAIAMDGGQHLAGPGTFAGLTSLTAEDWALAREKSKAASAASKAERSI